MSQFRWKPTTVAEFADFERSQGQRIVTKGNIHWKQVRPFFFRPLVPFLEYQPAAVSPPLGSHLGGCQFAVPQGSPANSLLNMLIFQNLDAYSLAALGRGRRRQIMAAARVFSIREITDMNEFTEKAFPIYLSFYERTEYQYKKERLNQFWFSRWAGSLYQFGKFLILGAYRNGELDAIWTSRLVEDTVFSTSAFANAESLHLNVNSLLLHSIREAAASSRQAKQIFVGMYKYSGAHGVDDFYLDRGCRLIRQPAVLRVNPLAMAGLRVFRPKERMKLAGIIQDANAGQNAAAAGEPGGSAKSAPSDNILAQGQSDPER
jgi:hypothetical protein